MFYYLFFNKGPASSSFEKLPLPMGESRVMQGLNNLLFTILCFKFKMFTILIELRGFMLSFKSQASRSIPRAAIMIGDDLYSNNIWSLSTDAQAFAFRLFCIWSIALFRYIMKLCGVRGLLFGVLLLLNHGLFSYGYYWLCVCYPVLLADVSDMFLFCTIQVPYFSNHVLKTFLKSMK